VFLLRNAINDIVVFSEHFISLMNTLREFFRGEIEPDSGDREETKSKQLYDNTSLGNMFPPIKLAGCILLSGIDRGNHDRANQLEKESNNIKAHEEWGDEPGRHPAQAKGSFLAGNNQKEDATE
jgi:hypothetical protein